MKSAYVSLVLDTTGGTRVEKGNVSGRPAGRSIRRPRLRNLRVLAVEDDADSRAMLAHILCEAGCIARVAVDGHHGFDEFQRDRPDALVSDLLMPVGDGYELIRRVRSLPLAQGRNCPAIALSAVHRAHAATEAGYDAFVPKPLDDWNLLDVLERVASEGPRPLWRPHRRGLRVLVVEDDADSRDMIALTLRDAGWVPAVAVSGKAAFAQFEARVPDVVLADLCMPDGDGYELIRRIRSRSAALGGLCPAIAISAVDGVRSAMRSGYNAFIAKPIDDWNMLDVIEMVLRANGN